MRAAAVLTVIAAAVTVTRADHDQTIYHSDPSFSYLPAGAWQTITDVRAASGSVFSCPETSTIQITLPDGTTSFEWWGLPSTSGGFYQVCIDCAAQSDWSTSFLVDGYSRNGTPTASAPLWKSPTLTANDTHHVIILNQNDPRINSNTGSMSVDAFVANIADSTPTTPTPTATGLPPPSPTPQPDNADVNKIALVVGLLAGIEGLAIVLIVVTFLARRRIAKRRSTSMAAWASAPPSSPYKGPGAAYVYSSVRSNNNADTLAMGTYSAHGAQPSMGSNFSPDPSATATAKVISPKSTFTAAPVRPPRPDSPEGAPVVREYKDPWEARPAQAPSPAPGAGCAASLGVIPPSPAPSSMRPPDPPTETATFAEAYAGIARPASTLFLPPPPFTLPPTRPTSTADDDDSASAADIPLPQFDAPAPLAPRRRPSGPRARNTSGSISVIVPPSVPEEEPEHQRPLTARSAGTFADDSPLTPRASYAHWPPIPPLPSSARPDADAGPSTAGPSALADDETEGARARPESKQLPPLPPPTPRSSAGPAAPAPRPSGSGGWRLVEPLRITTRGVAPPSAFKRGGKPARARSRSRSKSRTRKASVPETPNTPPSVIHWTPGSDFIDFDTTPESTLVSIKSKESGSGSASSPLVLRSPDGEGTAPNEEELCESPDDAPDPVRPYDIATAMRRVLKKKGDNSSLTEPGTSGSGSTGYSPLP